MTTTQPKVLYRCYQLKDRIAPTVQFVEFPILYLTPKGCWINFYSRNGVKKRWIGFNTNKPFAYITKELALESYFYRKRAQVRILKQNLHLAEWAFDQAEKLRKEFNK